MPTPVEASEWETESGLPNDVDAYIMNPRFDVKPDYAKAAGVASEMTKSIGATHRLNLAAQQKGAHGHRTHRRI